MAQLAIKGHATRGNEVIGILEMLGGKDEDCLEGTYADFVYYICSKGYIDVSDTISDKHYKVFTLEEFIAKYPYKVGDKVLYKTYGIYSKIKSMLWNEEKEQVIYRLDSNKLFVATADELQPYKEQETMTLNQYQRIAMSTCMESCDNFAYMSYGLMGELGELMSKIAKHIRKGNMVLQDNGLKVIDEFTKEDADALLAELGDCQWFVAGLAHVLGQDLEDVCQANLDKLASRKGRGVIDGEGDNR